jgi:hypothetical protein
MASNRHHRRRWAREANRALTEIGDIELARWQATRCLIADLDYEGTEDECPDAPVTLGGAAGRRQRSTAGSGEGAGEIAERVATGKPALSYEYDGPGGKIEALRDATEDRKATRWERERAA